MGADHDGRTLDATTLPWEDRATPIKLFASAGKAKQIFQKLISTVSNNLL